MHVLVDTPVWSVALRRKPENLGAQQQIIRAALADLIRDGRAKLMGPVRQELLSGIREQESFRRIRDHLREFGDAQLATSDYDEAADISNRCRAAGIAGSPIDFLLCAVAALRGWQLFTTDQDFFRYQRVAPIRLFAADQPH